MLGIPQQHEHIYIGVMHSLYPRARDFLIFNGPVGLYYQRFLYLFYYYYYSTSYYLHTKNIALTHIEQTTFEFYGVRNFFYLHSK